MPHSVEPQDAKRRSILELCRAVNSSLIIFGFAALETVLLDSGVYADRCLGESDTTCDAQLEAVNLLFVVNASITLAAGLFVNGWVMDLYGTKVAALVANAFMISAWVVLTLTAAGTIGENGWMLGFCLFACAIGLLDGLFHFANLFPGNESFIIGSISGFSDSSSVVFLIFAALFRQGISLRDIFIGYICLALVANLAFAVFLMPWQPVPDGYDVDAVQGADESSMPPTQCTSSSEQTDADAVSALDQCPLQTPSASAAGAAAVVAGAASPVPVKPPPSKFPYLTRPIAQQACTPLFLGWVLYSASSLLRFNFYVAAVNEHLDHLGQSGTSYSDAFGVIVSCGLLVVLAVGQVMDRWGLHMAVLLPTIVGVLLSLVTLLPSLPLQALGFLLAVVYRGFIFTTYAAVIIAEFGVGAYGRLSGLVAVTAGALSFLQQPLLQLSIRTFDGDFFVANAIMGVLSLSHFAFAAYYWQHRARSGLDGSHPVQWKLPVCGLLPVQQLEEQTPPTSVPEVCSDADADAGDVELGVLPQAEEQGLPAAAAGFASQASGTTDGAVLPAGELQETPGTASMQHLATSRSDGASQCSAGSPSPIGDAATEHAEDSPSPIGDAATERAEDSPSPIGDAATERAEDSPSPIGDAATERAEDSPSPIGDAATEHAEDSPRPTRHGV